MTDEQLKEIVDYEITADTSEVLPVYSIRTTKLRPDGKEKTAAFNWPGLPPLGSDEPLPLAPTLF